MISPETIAAAVEGGVITAAQAQRLMALENERDAAGAEPVDDERLRFISGFGDIFVTLGLLLFLSAAGYFLFMSGRGLAMWGGLAVLSWLLAEFFSRIRRMALPSIVLLLTFTLGVFSTAIILIGGDALQLSKAALDFVRGDSGATTFLAAGLITAGAAALHYARFKVPITIAAGVAAVACSILALAIALMPAATERWINLLILLLGVAVFALAMRFDLSDRERVTRRTDIAFWLHLLAAPLIVHPLVASMLGGVPLSDGASSAAILAIFALLGLVAVLVDRRALLVSGLLYAGFAFATLLKQTGLSYGTIAPATMLALGAFVLLLSAGWRPLRANLLKLFPQSLADRLPPPTVSHA
jgi:hypothetical protein